LFIVATQAAYSRPDSSYVCDYERKLSVKGFMFYNIIQLSNETDMLDYVPNNPLGEGIGVLYKDFLLGINYGQTLGSKHDKRFEETKAFDFQFHKYWSRVVVDIYFQQYKGFHIDDENLAVEDATCPDMKFSQWVISGQYVFNSKKFSYRAAFQQDEKQLKSAGSFLLGYGMYHSKITSDSSFIHDGKRVFNSYQWGFNAGYAYNWVVSRYWLINGSLSVGANLGNQHLKPFFDDQLDVNISALPRFSAGYNREKWSLGLSFVGSILSLNSIEDCDFMLATGRLEVSFLRRFNLKLRRSPR